MVKEGAAMIETSLTATGDIPPVPDDTAPVEAPPPKPITTVEVCIYVSTDEDGFIEGFGTSSLGDHSVEITVSSDHPIFDEGMRLWKLVDGKLEKPAGRLDSILAEEALRPPSTEEQLKAENKALSDRVDFLESVLEEMIFSIYE